jgi:hypothetical protein
MTKVVGLLAEYQLLAADRAFQCATWITERPDTTKRLAEPCGPRVLEACLPSGVMSTPAGQVVQWSRIPGQPCGTWRTAQGAAG